MGDGTSSTRPNAARSLTPGSPETNQKQSVSNTPTLKKGSVRRVWNPDANRGKGAYQNQELMYIGADGEPAWELTDKEPTPVATTQPTSSDDWGEPYVDPRKNWEKASDEDFFKIANLPAGFYGRLRDPEFRADVEKYQKAVRDGDLSPTGERARLMKKHPVLKMMTQKDTSITGNEIDTYVDPKFLKAVQVANRNEKLIPTASTKPNPAGPIVRKSTKIAPKADERRDDEIIPDNRIASDALDRPGKTGASTIDTTVGDTEDETQIGGAGKTIPLPQTADQVGLGEPNVHYDNTAMDKIGKTRDDYSMFKNKSRLSPNPRLTKGGMYSALTTNKPKEPKLTVDPLKKPRKFDPIKMKKIKSGPLASKSVKPKPRKVKSDQKGGLNFSGITSKKNNIVQQNKNVTDMKSKSGIGSNIINTK